MCGKKQLTTSNNNIQNLSITTQTIYLAFHWTQLVSLRLPTGCCPPPTSIGWIRAHRSSNLHRHEINRNVKEINPRFIHVSEPFTSCYPFMLPFHGFRENPSIPSQQHDCRSEHSHVTLPPREFRSHPPTRPACRAASNTAGHLATRKARSPGPDVGCWGSV